MITGALVNRTNEVGSERRNYISFAALGVQQSIFRCLGRGMLSKESEYLAKLKNAEAMASQFAEGSFAHENWLRIAEGYRDLLKGAPDNVASVDKQPLAGD